VDQIAEKAAVLNLLRATQVGAKKVFKLIDHFGSARMALTADDYTLETVGELTPDQIRGVRESSAEGFGERQLEQAERLGVRVLLTTDEEYPALLRQSHHPAAALYVIGEPLPSDHKVVAVVGSRKSSEYGDEIAHQIGAGLARAGICVISGMAYGIDSAAHRGTLQEGGKTIAVFGCGVDVIYPTRNRKLYDSIIRSGAVVSELFLGAGPEGKHFPMRNRLIAWMSVGTVVVEGGMKSGSLITASLALRENREVFAVPGHPLSPGHQGCNFLLRQGAGLVRHAGDILEDLAPILGLEEQQKQVDLDLETVPADLEEDEKRIFELLDPVVKIHADTISSKLNIDTSRLGAMLLSMEFKGCIQRLPGDHYRRKTKLIWK